MDNLPPTMTLEQYIELVRQCPPSEVYENQAYWGELAGPLAASGDKNKIIEQLITLMGNTPYWPLAIMRTIQGFGPAAVEPLITALKNPERIIRHNAALALESLADPRAIDPLLGTFNGPDYGLASTATIVLRSFGADVLLPKLKPLITENTPPNSAARYYAILTLGYLDGPDVEDLLLTVLKDGREWELLNIVRGLDRYGLTKAVEPLVEVLEKGLQTEGETGFVAIYTYAAVANALYTIRDRRAVPVLGRALLDKDAQLVEAAAKALGHIGDSGAIEPLIEGVRFCRSKPARYQIVNALARLGDPARERVRLALHDADANVRFGAAMTLGIIGDSTDLAELRRLAEADNAETFSKSHVRIGARHALKRLEKRLNNNKSDLKS